MSQKLKQLGSFIRQQRLNEKLTQEEFAKKYDIKHSALVRMELGEKNISINQLEVFASKLQMNLVLYLEKTINSNAIS